MAARGSLLELAAPSKREWHFKAANPEEMRGTQQADRSPLTGANGGNGEVPGLPAHSSVLSVTSCSITFAYLLAPAIALTRR